MTLKLKRKIVSGENLMVSEAAQNHEWMATPSFIMSKCPSCEGDGTAILDLNVVMVTMWNGLWNTDHRGTVKNPAPQFSWETFTSV